MDMAHALVADGPLREHADGLALFGRFVGSWAIDAVLIAADGAQTRHRDEWHFGWVLEGRAIQDVLISPPLAERARSGAPAFEYGTTIRVYDPAARAWRVTYVSPLAGADVTLTARAAGHDVVLDGRLADGTPTRWRFTEVTGTSFRWLGAISLDGGATWRVNEEMRATRTA